MQDYNEFAASIVQGTPEWHELRLKRFTGSEYHRLMGDCKRDMTEAELKVWKEANPRSTAKQTVDPHLLSTGAMSYVEEVASERATGLPAKIEFENDAMRWGKENEPFAKKLFAAAYDIEDGHNVGFIPYGEHAGMSPDWLVGKDFGCEIKCPISRAIHMKYRTLTNADDLKANHPNHYWQCIGGMLSTGFKMWKFISYHPHYDAVKQLKIINVPWDENDIKLLDIKLTAADRAANYLLTL